MERYISLTRKLEVEREMDSPRSSPVSTCASLDENGYPTIFKEYLKGHVRVASSATREASADSQTTQFYDDDGFPVLVSEKEHDACATLCHATFCHDDLAPIQPHPRKRKQDALAVRASIPRNKTSAAKTSSCAKSRQSPSTHATVTTATTNRSGIIEKATLGVSDKPTPRAEICGMIMTKNVLRKSHICTLRPAVWGPDFVARAKFLRSAFVDRRLNREQALQLRDETRAALSL